jgi:Xaa-Pro aminopeptidase
VRCRRCEITDAAFGDVVAQLKPGTREPDIVAEIEYQLRRRGSEPAYPLGVWGWGRSFPRRRLDTGAPIPTPIRGSTTIAFDFGAWWEGYCTDFSRVVHFEDPGPEYRAAYAAVVRAQDAAIAAMGAGWQTAEEVYEIGMAVLGDAGLREWFPDRLGHGIGMDVHELPSLYTGDATRLEAGMVLTVEPQVMKPDMHVRLEDLVLVGHQGGQKLNTFPNDLLVVG